MKPNTNTEAAETVQITDSQAVVQERLVVPLRVNAVADALPCAFCGSDDVYWSDCQSFLVHSDSNYRRIVCGKCGSGTTPYPHDALGKCRERWNTRANTNSELVEALRKAVQWGDGASQHFLYREKINWTYLEEARRVLSLHNDLAQTRRAGD